MLGIAASKMDDEIEILESESEIRSRLLISKYFIIVRTSIHFEQRLASFAVSPRIIRS